MGLVQKIFYFHVPCVDRDVLGRVRVRQRQRALSVAKGSREADHYAVAGAELAVVFGLIVLITGPLWARKAWGVWWEWDVKLTLALVVWLIFVAYLLLRRYGGPGSEKLAAGVGMFGVANMPFVYWSVNWWRTHASEDHAWCRRCSRACAGRSGSACSAFMVLMVLIVMARVRARAAARPARRAVS